MRAHPAALALLGAVALGGLLRLGRAAARWDEIALAYAAYAEPAARHLSEGEVLRAASSWVGLHPPLHGVLLGVIEVIWPVPALWLALSVLASLGAVVAVGRAGGWLAAAVLATAPIQLAYSAEVNNYPLAALAVALLLVAPRRPGPALLAAIVFACWSHVLTAMAAGATCATVLVDRRVPLGVRARFGAAASLAALPVVVGGLLRVAGEGTFVQQEPSWETWWATASAGVGWESVVLAVCCLPLLRGRAAVVGVALLLGYAAALVTGAAADHQRPYLVVFGPVVAVALGSGVLRLPSVQRRWVALVLGGLVAVQAGRAIQGSLGPALTLAAAQERSRGIDRVLAEAQEGDTLWLLAPALRPDDDKTATAPVLWRLRPWRPMPIARLVAFDYVDYRYGQPRRWGALTVHTSVELTDAVFDQVVGATLAAGARTWLVVYEHAPATGLATRVARTLRPYETVSWRVEFPVQPGMLGSEDLGGSELLGEDLVVRIDGLAGL